MAHQRQVLSTRSVIVDQSGDMGPIRIDGTSFSKKLLCNMFIRYPDMVLASDGTLVYSTILECPIVEGHPRICGG